MSILTLVQGFCRRNALAIPNSLLSASDTITLQVYQTLTDLVDEICQESKYNYTTREATFTQTAAEDQGSMDTLAPYGLVFPIFETFYDRTLKRPLYGPLDEQEWQAIKALPNPGPFYKFRIRGNHLLMNPTPAAPLSTIAFEYISSWAYTDSTGATAKAVPTEDSDLIIWPDRIMRVGLSFAWKRDRGLPYQADETRFWDLMNNYIARDKVKARINVANPVPMEIKPGVFIPSGNWMQ